MTNRRKFLERSALGAGSVLFLPALVGSCITDHDLSVPPVISPGPILGGSRSAYWNDEARSVVTAGLGLVPGVGEILGALVDIFWPSSKEDVWGEVKSQVEEIVDKKISDSVYQQVSEDLQGLSNSLLLYLNQVKDGNPVDIKTQWIVTRNLFTYAQPHFQSAGYELPLLGLFGQFATMYLAILRDGVAFGESWGMNPDERQSVLTDLQTNIDAFEKYAWKTWWGGRNNLPSSTDKHKCEPFRTINNYERQLTITVFDFVRTWSYFDVTQHPAGAEVVIHREIYSDPMGTCDDSGGIIVLPSWATQSPTNITVWAYDRIDAVQLTYPAGAGPGGVTQTKRMGDSNGGINKPPHGGTIDISPNNPIINVEVRFGLIVDALKFTFFDGTSTPTFGNAGNGSAITWGYDSEYLSSIHINGVSTYFESADAIILGFRYWQSPPRTLNTFRSMYVKSPIERSVSDFANVFPNVAVPADLINEELKSAREAHWASVKARAKALK